MMVYLDHIQVKYKGEGHSSKFRVTG